MRKAGYLKRVELQGRRWVNGDAEHNRIDGECTPDFSCCVPQLFESDRAKRVALFNEWAVMHNVTPIRDA